MTTALIVQIQLRLQARTVPPSLLLRNLVEFRKTYPETRFVVSSGEAGAIEADLIADRIQFGLVNKLQNADFLAGIEIARLRVVAVASPGYVAQSSSSLGTVEEVLAADLIDIDASLPSVQLWYGETIHEQVRPSLLVGDSGTAADAAACGGGVAFLAETLASPRIARGELVQLPDRGVERSVPLFLIYRKKNSRPLLESVFLESLMDHTLV